MSVAALLTCLLVGLKTSLFPEQPGSTGGRGSGSRAPGRRGTLPHLACCSNPPPPAVSVPPGALEGSLLPGVGGDGEVARVCFPLSARHFFFYVKDKGGEPPQMEACRLPGTHSSVRDSEWFTSRAQFTVFCFYLVFNQFLRKMMMNS